MVIDPLWAWCGGGEYGCSIIVLNSHHPFLPSPTQLSSPPPQRYAPPPLHPHTTGDARHAHTHTRTYINMDSIALEEIWSQGGIAPRLAGEPGTGSLRNRPEMSQHYKYHSR